MGFSDNKKEGISIKSGTYNFAIVNLGWKVSLEHIDPRVIEIIVAAGKVRSLTFSCARLRA